MSFRIIKIGISSEPDVVLVRQRARQISALLGFGMQDQVRIATAVSELSRHAGTFVTGGQAEFLFEESANEAALVIRIKNVGNAVREKTVSAQQEAITDNGFNEALISAQRLMDSCTVAHTANAGNGNGATTITLRKTLPPGVAITQAALTQLAQQLATSPVSNTSSEVQLQNQELLATLAELRDKQDSLLALTQELEDTNRGVVALYAEIEEKAERLRHADELKSRFLSNTSHELRTPLSSIRALSRLLLDRIDGELTAEQEKQIRFIDKAASDLSDLVNDLLDLAKIESGKIEINASPFSIADLFSALRGMLRPLATNPAVELVIVDPDPDLEMYSDEGKVSQVLRNFLSNALKFTERGEVRMTVQHDVDSGFFRFAVADTGIGIAPENLQFVFEEFSQVENPLQRHAKGTGLGLPLCRKLATLLGGHVELTSETGVGSIFSLVLPTYFAAPDTADPASADNLTGSRHHA
jgi:signal transduction histidine kinase